MCIILVHTEVLMESDEMNEEATYATERHSDAQIAIGTGSWSRHQHVGPVRGWQPLWF